MRSVPYGNELITYSVLERPELAGHYISVDRARGVVLKGRALPEAQADQLIQRKGHWILEKLRLVRAPQAEAIVTGSRTLYLGRSYYTEVQTVPGLARTEVSFNHSRFRVRVGADSPNRQTEIREALAAFLRAKAVEKLTTRVAYWARLTGLEYVDLRFRQMERRWGSCTPANVLVLNPEAIRLPYSLIDYLIVHELCHTKVKDHSAAFWSEVARHLPDWQERDERVKTFGG